MFRQFHYLFGNNPHPNLWQWTKVLQTLLNRVIEDQVDLGALRAAGGAWAELADANDLYEQVLAQRYMCDFARLQRHFLDFLNRPQGRLFLDGDGTPQHPPLLHVLVDEYQDTNLIQEQIYFTLASMAPHNLAVVGDDDQALYRFRGGTVQCMIGFGDRCAQYWSIRPTPLPLIDNHRSDERIVRWCNTYIASFSHMAGARVSGKPPLNHPLGQRGPHPAIAIIREKRLPSLAASFADTVAGLVAHGIVQDYSQCVLLLRSAKDSPQNAGPYITALASRGIPIYNPRSKAYLDQPEVQEMLGALLSILDPGLRAANAARTTMPGVVQMVSGWIAAYQSIARSNQALQAYVCRAQAAIQALAADKKITSAVPTIFYRILAHDPFMQYLANPLCDLRLSKLSRLLEAFCAQFGRELYTDKQTPGIINQWWLKNLYYIFCGYLETHGMDDDEDDEVVVPPGMLPIMTIHQAKGLEFDFVFVGSLGRSVSIGDAQHLEQDFRPFWLNPPLHSPSAIQAAWQDDIPLHFVAYSRAKYALILLATDGQLNNSGAATASFGGQGGTWARQNLRRL